MQLKSVTYVLERLLPMSPVYTPRPGGGTQYSPPHPVPVRVQARRRRKIKFLVPPPGHGRGLGGGSGGRKEAPLVSFAPFNWAAWPQYAHNDAVRIQTFRRGGRGAG